MASREVLPDDVLPLHYALTLTPNFTTFKYDGYVEIQVDVQVATKIIALNARELAISSASFKVDGAESGTKIECESFSVLIPQKRAVFTFEKVLPTGKNGILCISFQGIHNDEMAGFYRSSYLAKDGTRKHMVTTQFESIDARRAFPCWDEPARKATFEVTLITDRKYQVLSNMGEKCVETLENGLKKVQFATTPKMSTYLLAFIVGEFDYISDRTKDGVDVRCLAVPGKSDQCQFALKCGVKSLEFYNNFFGLPYPLSKVDMIAIPDFAAGAMENWGLVTYREIDLLCNEATASATHKMRLCSVVAHELAHQWFGNLVTMEWWNDLWLNEGFASFMQELASDHLFPEWSVWEAYVQCTQAPALNLDALRGSHPIQVDIARAEAVEEIFDAISYNKGSSVIRLVYRTLGHDKFQKGLQDYIRKFQYANTTTSDLWRAWEAVSDVQVEKMMKTWTEQMGFPLLRVSKEGSQLKITQEWYIGDGSKMEGDEKMQWIVPVVVGNGQTESQLHFMQEREFRVPMPTGSWIKVNFGQHVPLRVLYSEEMLTALTNGIPQLDPVDCIGLLGDSFALFKSNHLDGMKVLRMLGAFANNSNTNVWQTIAAILMGFEKLFLGLPRLFAYFKRFGARLIAAQSKALGWDHRPQDSDLTKQLRGILVTLQAKFCQEDPEVLQNAQSRYKLFLEDNDTKQLPYDYRKAAFVLVLSQPATMTKIFKELVDISLKESTDQPTRLAIYQSLGTAPSAEIKQEVLNWSITDDVRKQDFFYNFMGVVTSTKEGNDLGFEFFKKRWLDLKTKAPGGMMQAVVKLLCTGTDYQRADNVDAFFKDKPLGELARTIAQTNEATRATAKVIDEVIKNSDLEKDEEWEKLLA